MTRACSLDLLEPLFVLHRWMLALFLWKILPYLYVLVAGGLPDVAGCQRCFWSNLVVAFVGIVAEIVSMLNRSCGVQG